MPTLLENARSVKPTTKYRLRTDRPIAQLVDLAVALARNEIGMEQAAQAAGSTRGNMYAVFGSAFIAALRGGLVEKRRKA